MYNTLKIIKNLMICKKVKAILQKSPIFVIDDAFYCGDRKCTLCTVQYCKISSPVIFLGYQLAVSC